MAQTLTIFNKQEGLKSPLMGVFEVLWTGIANVKPH